MPLFTINNIYKSTISCYNKLVSKDLNCGRRRYALRKSRARGLVTKNEHAWQCRISGNALPGHVLRNIVGSIRFTFAILTIAVYKVATVFLEGIICLFADL